MYETKGAALLPHDALQSSYLLGLMNSSVINEMQTFISPTLDYHEGPLGKLPVNYAVTKVAEINYLVGSCIGIAEIDYDSSESSWEFARHPLV